MCSEQVTDPKEQLPNTQDPVMVPISNFQPIRCTQSFHSSKQTHKHTNKQVELLRIVFCFHTFVHTHSFRNVKKCELSELWTMRCSENLVRERTLSLLEWMVTCTSNNAHKQVCRPQPIIQHLFSKITQTPNDIT